MKIFFYDGDSKIMEPNYHLKMSSFGTVAYNMNRTLKKMGHFSDFNSAEWYGKCGSLDPQFRVPGRKSFYINVWETNNTLPYYLLQAAQGRNIFGLCNNTTNLWRKYGYNAFTIYGGCDTEFWNQTQPKDPNVFTFCHVAHGSVRSGLEVTLKAFAQAFRNNSSVKLIIKDAVSFTDTLLNFIKTLDCNNIEIVNEFWTVDKVRDLYSKSHATINLLRSAGFGLPLLECCACNNLCITGDVTPTNELVDSSFAKMIAPKGEINMFPFVTELEKQYGLKNYYGTFQYPEIPVFWDFDIDTVSNALLDVYQNWTTYQKINTRQPIINRWKWEYTVENLVKHLQILDENSIP
jgi:hypothetical protein